MRRKLILVLGIAVSATMLLLALRNSDLSSIRESLATASFVWSAPFLVSLLLFYWLKSARWSNLLSTSIDTRARDLFPSVMIGYAGTSILPMQMGELVRAYIVAKKYSLPYSLVISSIGMERIFDLLTILALLGVALASDPSMAMPAIFVKAGYIIGTVAIAGLVVASWLVIRTEDARRFAQFLTARMPAKYGDLALRLLDSVTQGFESIRQLRLVVRIAANSIIQWGLMGVCIWFSLVAVNIEIPMTGAILVLVATIIGISLPTSPGYVGNIQFAFVVALQPFGIDPAHAVAASIFYHVLAYVTVVIVGFSFLRSVGYGMLELGQEARSSSDN